MLLLTRPLITSSDFPSRSSWLCLGTSMAMVVPSTIAVQIAVSSAAQRGRLLVGQRSAQRSPARSRSSALPPRSTAAYRKRHETAQIPFRRRGHRSDSTQFAASTMRPCSKNTSPYKTITGLSLTSLPGPLSKYWRGGEKRILKSPLHAMGRGFRGGVNA